MRLPAHEPWPHEVAWAVMLAVPACWLLATHPSHWSGWAMLALLAAQALAAYALRRPFSTGTHLVAWAYYPVGMNIVYPAFATVVPLLRHSRFDEALYHADIALLGDNASHFVEPLTQPWLTDLLSGAYMFFMFMLLCALVLPLWLYREHLRAFFGGLFTVYGFGFLGYLLVPAEGPHLAFPERFELSLEGTMLARMNHEMVVGGSNHVDVFPSLHVAVSTFVLGYLLRHTRRAGWILLPQVLLLWLSTIYLRYHYLVDILAGFGLACAALLISRYLEKYPEGKDSA